MWQICLKCFCFYLSNIFIDGVVYKLPHLEWNLTSLNSLVAASQKWKFSSILSIALVWANHETMKVWQLQRMHPVHSSPVVSHPVCLLDLFQTFKALIELCWPSHLLIVQNKGTSPYCNRIVNVLSLSRPKYRPHWPWNYLFWPNIRFGTITMTVTKTIFLHYASPWN